MSEAGRVLFSSLFPTPHKLEGQKVGRYLRIMAAEGKGSRQLASSAPICFPERGEEISEDSMPEWLTLQKKKKEGKFLRMPSILIALELTIFLPLLGKLSQRCEFINTSSWKIVQKEMSTFMTHESCSHKCKKTLPMPGVSLEFSRTKMYSEISTILNIGA